MDNRSITPHNTTRNGETTFARARRQCGLDAVQAAATLGLKLEELQAFERGDELPDAVIVMHMARLYGVSADVLVA